MAQNLNSINLIAPAFKGINAEDSPLAQDPSFAEVADNAVIDKRGRIAARKGNSVITTTKTVLGSDKIRAIKEYKKNDGTKEIFSVGNNKIISGTTTLVDETPASYTISDDNWKIVNFNDNLYFFQREYEPLVYDGTSVVRLDSVTGAANVKLANEVLPAFGRLWVADIDGDKSTIYWSDLLIGHDFSGGTSGSINLSKVWPDGYDEVVALAAHNGLLIIFGTHSIVVYQGAEAPATMTLADTVSGVGCVDRDTIQYTGTDVLFLSHTGLKSFGRVIQQKSLPMADLSGNVTKDIIEAIQDETEFYRTVYSPEEGFYLVNFVSQDLIYCFDVRGVLENGAYRTTKWPTTGFTSFTRIEDGTLYIGSVNGISEYTGYQDNGSSYRFKYYSPSLSFGDSARIKILKRLRPIVVGGFGVTAFLKWGFDFSSDYQTAQFTIGQSNPGFYNESEYTEVEYTSGGSAISQRSLNTTGSGSSVVVGLEADIDGSQLSIQEINVMALVGRLV